MANNPGGDGSNQDFIDQLLDMQTYAPPNLTGTVTDVNLAGGGLPMNMMLQLSGGFHAPPVFPLGLSLDQGKPTFLKPDDGSGSGSTTAKRFREDVGVHGLPLRI